MFANLLKQLWSDDSGAVLSTEYIMLGSIVAAGGSTGMVALRDTMVEECKDYGANIRELRQSYMPQVNGNKTARAGQAGRAGTTDGQLPYWAMSASGNPVCVNCAGVTP